MLKILKYRIYPNKNQKILISQMIHNSVFVYNWILKRNKEEILKTNKNITKKQLIKELTELKKNFKYRELKYSFSHSLIQTVYNYNYKKYSKWKKAVFFNQYNKLYFNEKKIKIPKLGKISIDIDNQYFNNKIKLVLLTKVLNKYFIKIIIDDKNMVKLNIIKRIQSIKELKLSFKLQKLILKDDFINLGTKIFLQKSVLFFLLSTLTFNYTSNSIVPDNTCNYTNIIYKYKNDMLYEEKYEEIVNYIKEHESFVPYPYHTGIDTDKPSVGYGHVIKPGDRFKYPISEEFADSLLRKDFNGAMRLAKIYSPKFNDEQYRFQLLAISHFIFAKGIGNYNKSKLKYLVDNNLDISKEIIKWTVIRKNNVIYHNKRMLTHRYYEIKIYNIKPYEISSCFMTNLLNI